jgi:hypothetical protein
MDKQGVGMPEFRSETDSSTSTLLDHMESYDKANGVDVEKDAATLSSAPTTVQTNRVTLTIWMVVNTLATVAIVSGARFHVVIGMCSPWG